MPKFPMRNLVTLFQKRFISTSIGPQLQDSSSFTLDYLINSCGLSSKSALSISTSQKLKLNETKVQKTDLVLELLKSNGLDETHIAKLIEARPEILKCRVDSLKPKLDYFVANGCSGMIISELVSSSSDIINRSLDGRVKPSFDFFKELFGGSVDDVVKASKRCCWLFTADLERILKPNVDLLVKEGVPIRNLGKAVLSNPRILFRKPEDVVRDFNAVKKLGIDPKEPRFCIALRVLIQTSESILLKKMEVYKSLGWTQDEIMHMFRKNPIFFAYSEEKIKSGVDFYLNDVKVEREFLIAHPNLLTYSNDRIRRRFNILKALESKKLFKWDSLRVASLMTISEKLFFKNFVAKYAKTMPGLLDMNQSTARPDKLDI